jgi:hypothetical protein
MYIAFIIVSALTGILTDWVWTRCLVSVQKKNAFWAANWSVGIYLCGVLSTLMIAEKNIPAIIAYIVGGYIGTYLGVKYHKDAGVV